MGHYYQEAMNCDSWVRQEVVFRNIYAQQITEELLNNVHTDYELRSFIAQKITEKYRFYEEGASEPTEYTKALLEIVTEELLNNVHTDYELRSFIAQKITEKYRFYEEGASEPTEYTKALLEIVGNHRKRKIIRRIVLP